MENTEIIPIIAFHGQEGIQGVSARALYEFLYGEDANRNFARWAERYITTNEWAILGEDWVCVTSDANPQGGRPAQDYHLRLDFAKHVALQANTQKGQEVRAYFIAVEKRARAIPFEIPKTLSAALLLASQQAAQLEAQAPMVAFAEKVQGSPSLVTVDECAKALGLPVVAFRKFVQGKYLFRRHGEWWPYEEYGENGRKWFEMTSGTWEARSGENIAYHTCKVTGLGKIKLRDAWERAQTMAVPA